MSDIGEAAMHHDLHAVGPAALIGMADDAHVARVIGLRQVGSFDRRRGNSARRSSPAWRHRSAAASCMRRSSSVLQVDAEMRAELAAVQRRYCLPIGWRSAL